MLLHRTLGVSAVALTLPAVTVTVLDHEGSVLASGWSPEPGRDVSLVNFFVFFVIVDLASSSSRAEIAKPTAAGPP